MRIVHCGRGARNSLGPWPTLRKPHNYLTDSPEFGLTFRALSGEKWGVVAENVTRDLNLNESGCENALFRDFRAFDGREEARGSTCAVAY